MKKKSWMAELAYHFENIRNLYPKDRLMIVFDIDGTILDMRYMIFNVLKEFDRNNDTHFFNKLEISDITVHENHVDALLSDMQITQEEQDHILEWYNHNRWTVEYTLNAHHPFHGVLEVIRWFQLQPNTYVGLNTGRPESLRTETIRSLNQLGKEYKVHFSEELLNMNPHGWEQKVKESKIKGLRKFQDAGYRVFAIVDNEPSNLKEISKIDRNRKILLLHANTIFESKRIRLPSHTVKGKAYDLTELIPEKSLPKHIQFVWHGINDEVNLRQFLASDITWGECDIRMTLIGNELILRHDSFKKTPLNEDEEYFNLDHLLNRLSKTDKSIKFDLKAGAVLIDSLMKLIDYYGFDESRLWFNGNVERLQEQGFKKLANTYPNAILQTHVDFLAPLVSSVPEKAKDILDLFTSWGINRFSINWWTENMRTFFDQMDKLGFEVNLYNVPDLESFLQAILLMPRSITSDFNFPKWHYYGRGSGKAGNHYEYIKRKTSHWGEPDLA